MQPFSSRISKCLFALASMSVMAHTLLIGTPWGSLYFAFIFALSDFRFWILSFVNFKPAGKSLLFVISLVLIYSLNAKHPFPFLYKFSGIILFIYYFFHGIRSYGTRYVIWGTRLAVFFGVCQFIEANFFRSQILNAANFHFNLPEGYWFGAAFEPEGSYASHIIPGLMRVSSFTAEPGHFSSILTAMLPIILASKRKSFDVSLWIIGVFICASKVSLVQLPMILVALAFAWHGTLSVGFAPILFFMYVVIGISLFSLYGREQMVAYNSSIFERFNGGYLYTQLDPWEILAGTGWQRACDVLPDELTRLGESMQSFVEIRGNGQLVCAAGVHSSIGSFLLECGLLGAICLFGIYGYHLTYHKFNYTTDQAYLYRTGLLVFLLAILSVHYLTFFPSFYTLLSFVAALKNPIVHRGIALQSPSPNLQFKAY